MARAIWSRILSTEHCISCNDGSQPRRKTGSEWPIRHCAASTSVTICSKRQRPSSDYLKQQSNVLSIVETDAQADSLQRERPHLSGDGCRSLSSAGIFHSQPDASRHLEPLPHRSLPNFSKALPCVALVSTS